MAGRKPEEQISKIEQAGDRSRTQISGTVCHFQTCGPLVLGGGENFTILRFLGVLLGGRGSRREVFKRVCCDCGIGKCWGVHSPSVLTSSELRLYTGYLYQM